MTIEETAAQIEILESHVEVLEDRVEALTELVTELVRFAHPPEETLRDLRNCLTDLQRIKDAE